MPALFFLPQRACMGCYPVEKNLDLYIELYRTMKEIEIFFYFSQVMNS